MAECLCSCGWHESCKMRSGVVGFLYILNVNLWCVYDGYI
jgi:hypothetical protein